MDARAELTTFFQRLYAEISQKSGSSSDGALAVKQALCDVGYGLKKYPAWVLNMAKDQLPEHFRKVIHLRKALKHVQMNENDFELFFRHRLQRILTDHPRAMSEFHKKQSQTHSHRGILAAIEDKHWKLVLDVLTRKFKSLIEFPELVDFAETQIVSQRGC